MKILGVGVDLVNVTRIQEFLERHPAKKIARLLSPQEQKRYARRKISARAFARLFAAKEAFFKTLNAPWMGLEGFAAMNVTPSGECFSIEIVDDRFRVKGNRKAQGSFFRAGKLLGAQVVRWDA